MLWLARDFDNSLYLFGPSKPVFVDGVSKVADDSGYNEFLGEISESDIPGIALPRQTTIPVVLAVVPPNFTPVCHL